VRNFLGDLKFSSMLKAMPPAGKSEGSILPEYSQLLLGCLLSALLLCTPVIVYTNHVKGMAMMATPVLNSQGLMAEADTRPNIVEGDPQEAVSNSQQQNTGTLGDATRQQSAGVAAGSTWALDHKGGNTLASQKTGTSKLLFRQVSLSAIARGKSAARTFSRTWARNRAPRRVQTAWVAIWRETLKRLQKTKSTKSGS
jgi:hypothetical protein